MGCELQVGLHVGCHDLCMIIKVTPKGVAVPTTLGFDRVEDALQHGLGPGDENYGFFAVVVVSDIVLHIGHIDVQTGVKTIKTAAWQLMKE